MKMLLGASIGTLLLGLLVHNQHDKIAKTIFGIKRKKAMSPLQFKIMSFIMSLVDLFIDYGKVIEDYEIEKGQVVCDYGTGPGRLIKPLSDKVGGKGKVIAIDIVEAAGEKVQKVIEKYDLKNVEFKLSKYYDADLDDHMFDRICVVDMFHMIDDTTKFLQYLNRLCKSDGFVFISIGEHQKREITIENILKSEAFAIIKEGKLYLKLKPLAI